MAVGLVAGGLGGLYADQHYPDQVPLLFSRAPRGNLDRADVEQALRVLRANYYETRLDYTKLTQGSLRGMVDSLNDPFSEYLSPDQYGREQSGLKGEYTGIGIYVSFKADYPTISGIIPGSPADKAGLRADDVIHKVDGKDARGLKADQTTAEIQGPEGSPVTLTIQRGDRSLDVRVVRGKVVIPFVRSLKLPKDVLYLRIYKFGETTTADFDQQLTSGLRGSRGVVLDLRDNPGGFIDSAAAVISRFVDHGEAFELHDRGGAVERHVVSGDHPAVSTPLVVLVNGNSASSSEIVAGSLRVGRKAPLVGARTFGKGSVQQDYPLGDGGDIHLTIRKWFLPDGSSVDNKGLAPDMAVQLGAPDDMFDVTQAEAGYARDTQLNQALQLLN